METAIVALIGISAVAYFVKRALGAWKGTAGCGCGEEKEKMSCGGCVHHKS